MNEPLPHHTPGGFGTGRVAYLFIQTCVLRVYIYIWWYTLYYVYACTCACTCVYLCDAIELYCVGFGNYTYFDFAAQGRINQGWESSPTDNHHQHPYRWMMLACSLEYQLTTCGSRKTTMKKRRGFAVRVLIMYRKWCSGSRSGKQESRQAVIRIPSHLQHLRNTRKMFANKCICIHVESYSYIDLHNKFVSVRKKCLRISVGFASLRFAERFEPTPHRNWI